MQKMIGKMAKMYPMLVAMGFMIVAISFVIGYLNSQTAAVYFAADKVTRETTMMAQHAAFASTDLWLPYFKFLGVGLLLGGIVMALRIIIDSLKSAGVQVMGNLPEGKRPALPAPPWYGPMMPMVMMLGEMIFIIAFIIALGNAATAREVFTNPNPVIDAAGAGSTLLAQLASTKATSAWLVPFKFFGIATEFLAIAMGLSTIVFILDNQIKMIDKGLTVARKE